MIYEFKLGHNTTEATKNICVNGEGEVYHSTVTRWFKKWLGLQELQWSR